MSKELKLVTNKIDKNKASDDDKYILKLQKYLLIGSVAFIFTAAPAVLGMSIIGCWTELIRKSSYVFPISMILGKICKALCTASVSVFREASTSPESRSKVTNGTNTGIKRSLVPSLIVVTAAVIQHRSATGTGTRSVSEKYGQSATNHNQLSKPDIAALAKLEEETLS